MPVSLTVPCLAGSHVVDQGCSVDFGLYIRGAVRVRDFQVRLIVELFPPHNPWRICSSVLPSSSAVIQ